MAKDPAFLFYPNDWIGGTMGMTFEQKGAYMELLMLQFNRGHMTKHMIGHILGQSNGQIWDTIKDKFEVDEQGNFYNIRLEQEQIKRKLFTDSRKNNISGNNQFKKETIKKGHMDGHMSDHMENENENENIIEDKIENKETLKEQKLRLLNERKKVFALRVAEFKDKYPDEMLRKFFEYWSEMNKSGSQMRWEMERTWELGKRLVTWASRTKDFNTVRELISFDELTRRFNNGEKDMWDKYEPVKPGDKKTLWRKKL